MALTVNRYNHTLKLWVNGEVDQSNLKAMLLTDDATFDGTDTDIDDVAGAPSPTRANELFGNGWTEDGELLDSVAVTVVSTDGAMVDCADETVTATGGPIPPSGGAYKTVVYDATNGWPLWFYTHNVVGGESAGEGTEFKIIPNGNGLMRLVTAS
jgi:hypothetical protein